MTSRHITTDEQSCISNCIYTHWGKPNPDEIVERIDEEYQKCLSECQICA